MEERICKDIVNDASEGEALVVHEAIIAECQRRRAPEGDGRLQPSAPQTAQRQSLLVVMPPTMSMEVACFAGPSRWNWVLCGAWMKQWVNEPRQPAPTSKSPPPPPPPDGDALLALTSTLPKPGGESSTWMLEGRT